LSRKRLNRLKESADGLHIDVENIERYSSFFCHGPVFGGVPSAHAGKGSPHVEIVPEIIDWLGLSSF
jgi:hypothetical protein